MKSLFFSAIAFTVLATSAQAAVNYTQSSVSTFKTLAQIQADTANANLNQIDGVFTDAANDRVFINMRTGAGNLNFLVLYTLTGSYVGVTADLDAADGGDFRGQSGFTLAGGNFYAGDFGGETTGNESIKVISPTPGGSLTNLLTSPDFLGGDDIATLSNNNLVYFRGANFSGNNTAAEVTTAGVLTGNTIAFSSVASNNVAAEVLGNGNIVVLGNQGGQLDLITGFPGGSAAANPFTITGYTPVNPNAITKGEAATDFVFSDRGTGANNIYVVDGSTNTLRATVPFTALQASFSASDRDGLASFSISSNRFAVLASDFNDTAVYQITFGQEPVTSAESWNLYSF